MYHPSQLLLRYTAPEDIERIDCPGASVWCHAFDLPVHACVDHIPQGTINPESTQQFCHTSSRLPAAPPLASPQCRLLRGAQIEPCCGCHEGTPTIRLLWVVGEGGGGDSAEGWQETVGKRATCMYLDGRPLSSNTFVEGPSGLGGLGAGGGTGCAGPLDCGTVSRSHSPEYSGDPAQRGGHSGKVDRRAVCARMGLFSLAPCDDEYCSERACVSQ